MLRSIVEHEVQISLYIHEIMVRVPVAQQYFVAWRIGKECVQCPVRVPPNETRRLRFESELSLNIKIAYDIAADSYREKKTFLMLFYNSQEHGSKLAGLVTINIARVLTKDNMNQEFMVEDYVVERCQDKRAVMSIGFRWKVLEENRDVSVSYLNESAISIRSEQLRPAADTTQYGQLVKENQEIKRLYLAMKEDVQKLAGQYQTILDERDSQIGQLEEENRYLRDVISQSQQDRKQNYSTAEDVAKTLSQDDVQDLKALEAIKVQCFRLQAMKPQSEGAMIFGLQQQIMDREEQMNRLNDVVDCQKQKIQSLQYVNNLLLKQEDIKQLKINKLEEEVCRLVIVLDETTFSKEEELGGFHAQIDQLRYRNRQLNEQINSTRANHMAALGQLEAMKKVPKIQESSSTTLTGESQGRKYKQRMNHLLASLRLIQTQTNHFKSVQASIIVRKKPLSLQKFLQGLRRVEDLIQATIGVYRED